MAPPPPTVWKGTRTPSATATVANAARRSTITESRSWNPQDLPPSSGSAADPGTDHLKRSAAHGAARAVASVAAVAIAIASPFGLGPATVASTARLHVLAKLTQCPVPESLDVDLLEFPFQPPLPLAGSPDGAAALNGGLLMNTLLASVAAGVARVAFARTDAAWHADRPIVRSFVAMGAVLLPGYFAPAVWSTAAALVAAGTVGGAAAGVYLACIAAVSASVAHLVWAAVVAPRYATNAANVDPDAAGDNQGSLELVNAGPMPFVEVYGPVVDAGRAFPDPWSVRLNAAIEVLAATGVAAAFLITHCTLRLAVATAIAAALLVYAGLVRPLASRLESGFFVLNAMLQFAAVGLMLAAHLAAGSASDETLGTLAVAYDGAMLVSAVALFVLPVCVGAFELLGDKSSSRTNKQQQQPSDEHAFPLLVAPTVASGPGLAIGANSGATPDVGGSSSGSHHVDPQQDLQPKRNPLAAGPHPTA